MLKKFNPLISRIANLVGMPVCSEEDPIPEVNFNFCDPDVKLSEIKRVFFGMVSSDSFDDWFNPASWEARLSQTSTDRNAIRALTCTADKPQPSAVRKTLSGDRRKITSKTHVIHVTVDEATTANHEFFRSLKKGKKLRCWYETMGGLMFGSNDGIIATVFADMVLNRGVGEIQIYEMEIIWETLELEQWINSPIFEDPGTPDPEPIDFEVVLYPEMKATPNGVAPPSVPGYWSYKHEADLGFININPLIALYPVPLVVRHVGVDDYFSAGVVGDVSEVAPVNEPLKYVDYEIPWDDTRHIVFQAVSDWRTIEFEDILGNKAYWRPLIILDRTTNTVADYLIAGCTAELLYTAGDIATIRLHKTHAAALDATIGSITTSFAGFSLPVRPDPDHPLDGDYILIDVPPGYYSIAVQTTYMHTAYGAPYPKSYMSFVFRV